MFPLKGTHHVAAYSCLVLKNIYRALDAQLITPNSPLLFLNAEKAERDIHMYSNAERNRLESFLVFQVRGDNSKQLRNLLP